jgi:regulator of protease activity HflC (stomatin/prohibitin superfamily)
MDGVCGFGVIIFILVVLFAVIVPLASMTIRIVRQSTVGLVERLGRFKGIEQPGLVFLIPIMDKMYLIDMREQVFALRPQPVITQDNVTMNIDAVIYYQITDPKRATYEVAHLVNAVEQLALTTLRNIIGDMTLDETLSSRDTVNDKLQLILDEATTKWGLKVNRVELKDINPPRDIEEAMQKQMRAERTKRAAILTAEGEREAAIKTAEGQKQSAILEAEGQKEAILLNAQAEAERIRQVKQAEADMIERVYQAIHNGRPTPELIHIKYLEALEKVSSGQSNTLLLPFESSAFMGSIVSAAQGFKIPRRNSHHNHGANSDINPEG